ncbi:LysR family transcriptional regulator [Kroppenstedtia pulmonis]|uniref:LysR family transcriptional regulator n=1 Tax=Kroppenstedtia pulmonis TaxID=1380685 RepID=A0A7D4BGS2_9BACL|nr:LysR family transcriptional regulator [Kroppenstedtia pulmonis]QKG85292.1 LysR family transcriptional regulator [Kroppenstedtia pulmonis]
MTLAQLQVFITAAESGSFTRAADSLGYTQSAVSQMVNSLEKELGVQLFHRSRSGIATTGIGERMLSHARHILQITSCMQQEAASAQGLEEGVLRIGSIPSVAAKVLPSLIGSFRRRFPQVDIVLFEGEHEEIHNWITSSVVDVGFTSMPDKELHTIPLLWDEMRVILPDQHSLKDEPFLTFSQIRDRCFIMPKDHSIKQLLRANGITPDVTFEVRDVTTILAMVQEWIGVTIVPELYLPEVKPKVVALPLRPAIKRELVLVVRNLQSVSPITAEFIVHSQRYVSAA